MQRFGLARKVKSAVVLTLATSLIAAPAAAGTAPATAPQVVSGPTPLPREGEPGWCGSDINYQDWEFDDTLAVNPTNPDNIAIAWVQDFNDGIVAAVSSDGGGTWEKTVITPPCQAVPQNPVEPKGGTVSADDPWLSFGPDGALYLSWRLVGRYSLASSLVVSRSLDGGETWLPPVLVDSRAYPYGIDVTNVVADPRRPGYAYVTWAVAEAGVPNACPPVAFRHYVSHTDNGGVTWSPPAQVPGPVEMLNLGQLVVLRDGTLLDVIVEVPAAATTCKPNGMAEVHGPTTLSARRSSNFGVDWSGPTPIWQETDGTADVSGQSAAVAPDGTVYVSWQTRLPRPPGSDSGPLPFTVLYSKSSDGGQTWQSAAPVGEPLNVGPVERVLSLALARPALAVAADGTVGVGFYDRRNATDPTDVDHQRAVDYWLRHSHDGGETWQEDHLAGPYDRTLTADTLQGTNRDGLVGSYQGLAAIPGGFAASFALGEPLAEKNTDIFFSRLLVEADLSLTKSGPSGRAPTGRNMTYTLTMANNGPDGASGVTVTDQLPASVSYVSASPSQGSCGESAGTVMCALGAMANGAAATVDIVVRPNSAGTITNTATVSALTPDPNEANNTDSVGTSICRITSRRSSIPCG